MPTKKPRITITLEPGMSRLLDELADLQGRRRGEILSDLLETVREPFERVAVLLKAAKEAPANALAGLRASALQAEAALLPIASQGMGQLDMLIEQAKGTVSPSGARRPAPTSKPKTKTGSLNPHVVTRGSGIPSKGSRGSRVVPIGRAGKGRKP